MGIDIGKSFKIAVVGGFTLTKQVKFVNEKNETFAFSKETLKGEILDTALDLTADKGGKEILYSFRNGDFMNVYGEKFGELYAKTFRCRKPLLLKTTDGREFRLRTASIWQVWLPLPRKYVLEGKDGIEATYSFNADKSGFKCEIAENSTIPAEVIATLGALIVFQPLHVGDTKNTTRIIEAEDADDAKDARLFWRLSLLFGLLMLAAFLLKCAALIFDKK